MKKFLKDNIFIVLGISLPVMLVVIFAFSTIIPAMYVEDPKYSLIFESNSYSGINNNTDVIVEFIVKNDRIVPRYKKSANNSYNRNPRLYIYDVKNQKVRGISYPTPDSNDLADDKWIEFEVEELKNLEISNAAAAPDGYEYTNSYRRSHIGLNVFSYYSGRDIGIRKDARLIKIGDGKNLSYYNTRPQLKYETHQFVL